MFAAMLSPSWECEELTQKGCSAEWLWILLTGLGMHPPNLEGFTSDPSWEQAAKQNPSFPPHLLIITINKLLCGQFFSFLGTFKAFSSSLAICNQICIGFGSRFLAQSWLLNTHCLVPSWHLMYQPAPWCVAWWGMEPGLEDVPSLSFSCSSHIKNLLSCWTRRIERSCESRNMNPSAALALLTPMGGHGQLTAQPRDMQQLKDSVICIWLYVCMAHLSAIEEKKRWECHRWVLQPYFVENNIRGEKEALDFSVMSSLKKTRGEHLRMHSHKEQLGRKEVTRSKEKHASSLERESSWLPVCLTCRKELSKPCASTTS